MAAMKKALRAISRPRVFVPVVIGLALLVGLILLAGPRRTSPARMSRHGTARRARSDAAGGDR